MFCLRSRSCLFYFAALQRRKKGQFGRNAKSSVFSVETFFPEPPPTIASMHKMSYILQCLRHINQRNRKKSFQNSGPIAPCHVPFPCRVQLRLHLYLRGDHGPSDYRKRTGTMCTVLQNVICHYLPGKKDSLCKAVNSLQYHNRSIFGNQDLKQISKTTKLKDLTVAS